MEREFVQFISDSGGMEGLKKTYEKDRTVRGKLKVGWYRKKKKCMNG